MTEKKVISSIVFCLTVAGLVLCSCRRDNKPEETPTPEIVFTTSLGTKAMLENTSDLHKNGSKVLVHDIITGFTGQLNGSTYTNATVTYFSDAIISDGTKWAFEDLQYQWTRTGVHNFFGWLDYDAKSNLSTSPLNPTYNENTHILTIPEQEITSSSPQIDFLYSSEISKRDATTKDYHEVPLKMGHLFSAFALTVENRSTDPVTITSVTVPGLPVSGRASLNYDIGGSTAPVVTYNVPGRTTNWTENATTVTGNQFFSNQFGNGITLAAKDEENNKVNAFTGAFVNGEDTPADYRLIWPVSDDVISPENEPAEHADSLIRISYSYTINRDTPQEQTFERKNVGVKFPHEDWTAGKRYAFNITVDDKVVDLTFEVQPWEFYDIPMEFSSNTATVISPFSFVEDTFSKFVGKDYYTKGALPIQASFRITNPIGSTIFVEPIGDTAYFTVSLNHTTVDPSVDNGTIVVTVTPNTKHGAPTESKRLKLRFYITNGVQEVNIDSEVRGDGYTIVWEN